ncbi:hypothetical protein GF339_07510 [candidate division KSB3 bacterium]|uniref:CheW-like domain-containing protein n=1 Tax=candidate division KSB3 bacterium TaxID=2044937 RepID=A0A9D5Q5N0_9BACT|nr:hypothetical protein [candidate division KSB3 bacterium]MBD3324417.1 hypothetical protein [candidate division KSB3 bacterium]
MHENSIRLACFEICGEKFAFNMEDLLEIVEVVPEEIHPMSSPNPLLLGTWDYRGTLLYILDLRKFFGLTEDTSAAHLPKTQQHKPDCQEVLVVNVQEHRFGLLVDAVLQVAPLGTFYDYPPMVSTLPRRYIAGVTPIGADLVLLVALEELLNDYGLHTVLTETTTNAANH